MPVLLRNFAQLWEWPEIGDVVLLETEPTHDLFALDQVVFVIATFLECAALIIITFASIHALWQLLKRWFRRRKLIDHREVVRLEYGLSLALSLEFLLAADIVNTAVAPTWEALGKLGVVAAIRTFLNYFLEQEVAKIEEKSERTQVLMRQIQSFEDDNRESF
ncbi:MAG: DUF1622 domain-containing protein [Limnothrix sp.]